MGMVDAAWAESMRLQLPDDEYLRHFLCRNVQARNWIWETYIKQGGALGLEAGTERAQPLPGMQYKPRGLLSFGYDHTGHGERPEASKSALVVTEQIGNWITFPFAHWWPPGVDDQVIRRDLVAFWEYFRPQYATGDAYGVGMLTAVNDDLFQKGLTEINRQTINDGQSNASSWSD